jgi:hypothetical protein
MANSVFDRETLLDLLVNVIPLGILLFFTVLFIVDDPFSGPSVYTWLQFAIVLVTFVLLAILTYFSGRAIASDEHARGGPPDLPPGGVAVGTGATEESADDEGDAAEADAETEAEEADSETDAEDADADEAADAAESDTDDESADDE